MKIEVWAQRHALAMACPKGIEKPLVRILEMLEEYNDAYSSECSGPIGEDGVLGACWLQIASGLQGLLNGPTGRLDCGSFDRSIRDLARAFSFSEQEADTLESD
jgi:hypothetical protein